MLNSIISSQITIQSLLICLVTAVAMGILTSIVFSYKNQNSKSLSFTLAVLPAAMCMIVMMINGNLGVAVSVAGGFTLVRFRSVAGTGREICAIFFVMTLGVILGMGYIGIAAVFFLLICSLTIILTSIGFGENGREKLLKVTIPEDYDYNGLLDDVFEKNRIKAEIESVKTTNMGSLIDVTYKITTEEKILPKAVLDEIRTRNANLSVTVGTYATRYEKL